MVTLSQTPVVSAFQEILQGEPALKKPCGPGSVGTSCPATIEEKTLNRTRVEVIDMFKDVGIE